MPDPIPAEADGCLFSGRRHDGTCGRQAVITITAGCVHEHVHADVPVCQYHVEEVAAKDAYCYPCGAHDGHDCPLMFDPRSARDLESAYPGLFLEVADA
ncbi:hypothetical protein DMB42_11690 [Nonomuraea sp. WAC 01424]|uniref:hypothetical protein n=1 Tax=Nonomuraea sp. WAC 01424 TaxID=2203200 RepID=UPI000F7857B7|nr:hypothetical protein [Nonomuraea sp. WAC 01424]RSN12833.1 hypothetical protein DMB42_11690 [Nonomuraea sp. WAC 01424]